VPAGTAGRLPGARGARSGREGAQATARPCDAGAVRDQDAQDVRQGRDDRRPGDRPGEARRRGGPLGVYGDSADVAAVSRIAASGYFVGAGSTQKGLSARILARILSRSPSVLAAASFVLSLGIFFLRW